MSRSEMLSNEPRAASKFVYFRKGKLVNGGQEFLQATGKIVYFEVTDEEYAGKNYQKMNLTLRKDKSELILGFSLSSGYGMGFIAMIPNIDLGKEVQISGGQQAPKNEGEQGYGIMYIAQKNEKGVWVNVKHFYTSKSEKKLPPPLELKDKKGKVIGKDWSEREAFIEKLLLAWEKKLVKENGVYEAVEPDAEEPDNETDAESIIVDELPF